jgi:hypothetical protein
LLERARRDLLPPEPREPAHSEPSWVGHAGFELDASAQLDLLREFEGDPYRSLFEALRGDKRINVGFRGVDYRQRGLIHNGYFPTPDAELYGAMILRFKPTTVIEIGSGFSTAVARAAIDHGGLATRLHVIDPDPRTTVDDLVDQIERTRVEDSSLRHASVSENTLLFIDSSHVVRSGGDAPFLYCELLPSLPANVLVHVHDVFLPYDYPAVYVDWLYAEQYLLHALLANSRQFEVVFATYFMSRQHRDAIQSVFGAEAGQGDFSGASFWMRTGDAGG